MTEPSVRSRQQALCAHRAGNLDAAALLYRDALAENPHDAEALHLFGVLRDAQGAHEDAAKLIEDALRQRDEASYHCNLAMVLGHLGRHEDALAAAKQALAMRPAYPEALNNLGVSLAALDRTEEAIRAYEAATASRPGYAGAWINLGHARRRAGQLQLAAIAYERVLVLNPEASTDPETLGGLATVLAGLNRLSEAENAARRALLLRPEFVQAHVGLGNILRQQDRHEEAEASLRHALALHPADAGAYRGLALVLDEQDRPHEARALLDLAIGLKPDDAEARHHRAMLRLRQGRYQEGWAEYDWRFSIGQAEGAFRGDAASQWRGEPLEERTILLTPEQGLGDTIQFCRYAPLVAARSAHVRLGAPRALARLLRHSFPQIEVIAEGEQVPTHALHCPLLSLPNAFSTTVGTVPAAVPYLTAPTDALQRWRARLPPVAGLRAGIVWAGNPNHLNDRRRSLDFAALAPLWTIAGVRWHSLQVGQRSADLREAPAECIDDLAPEFSDFAETAAAIMQLDLVVTPDTAVAHLAGALGVPVLVMLSFATDWRWIRGQETSPWYPSMRLIRQQGRSGWGSVIERVAGEVQARADIASRAHRPRLTV